MTFFLGFAVVWGAL